MALKIVRISTPPGASAEGAPVVEEPPIAPVVDSETPSLTGPIGAGAGPKLLMHLFSEGRTGRLVIEAPGASGTLCVLRGEPAHAVITDDGRRVEARLMARGLLRPLTEAPAAARARHPLSALSRRSDPISVLEALREEVRAYAASVLAATDGSWAFFDDEPSLDTAPLTPVNPFGFVLDARRRSMSPQELLALDQLGMLFVIPLQGFEAVTARLTAFTGGIDIATLVDGTHTARDVLAQARLDPMMGGLVLRTLADAALMRFSPSPPPEKDRNARRSTPPPVITADSRALSALAAAPKRGGLDLLALYLDVKPEREDTAVLGVEGSAGIAALERGYQNRLAELDARAIPEGPNRPFLLSLAEELRTKIERAYQRRMGSRSRTKSTSAYQILDRIGAGGMAEVFRGVPADDPTHFIAIKVVLPELREDAKFSQMFLEEARLARRIQHPNVVRVLSVGRGTEDLYLAMEYVDGLDFHELLRRAREAGQQPRLDVVARVIAEACAGLHAAHTAHDRTGAVTPILHRDVSPQNILVSRTGEVKLSDFGIAKAMDSSDDEPKGSVKGKIPYLAPELLRGEPASPQSDIYAMAMTAYAALGRLPFQRPDRVDTMRAILQEPLPPLSSLAPGVPPIVDSILLTAAARDPRERHQTALQLQLELEEILSLLPPVDVATWARPLAGARGDPGAPTRPITSVRSSTGLTGDVRSSVDALKTRPGVTTAVSAPSAPSVPSAPSAPPVSLPMPPRQAAAAPPRTRTPPLNTPPLNTPPQSTPSLPMPSLASSSGEVEIDLDDL